jgi:transposase-like protein
MSQEEKNINPPDPEVVSKPQPRRYTAEYKLRMLKEYDACEQPGEKGALLRREGIYASNISTWRRQYSQGGMDGLHKTKRGPKADPQTRENKKLRQENEQLKKRLQHAELIIEVQKKVSQILEIELNEQEHES